MGRDFTTEDIAFIVEKHEEHWSHQRIGRVLKVRTSRIVEELRKAGLHPRPVRFRLSAEQEREVVERYLAGELPTPLGREFGCHAATIRLAVKRAGHAVSGRGGRARVFSPQEIDRIRQMAVAGSSQAEIAYALGAGQTRISQLMRDHGIAPSRVFHGAGAQHAGWKGGRYRTPHGYMAVSIPPSDSFAAMRTQSGYVLEHRLVMARWLGRPLGRGEQVHHRDGNKLNNAIDNLQLLTSNHGNGCAWRCRDCGSYNVAPAEIERSAPIQQ